MAESGADACAACGKGSDGLKTCNGCKMVKYCSRDCQADHRPTHRAACKRRAAELFDEELFQQPKPQGDCPLCIQRLPLEPELREYMTCCGQVLCAGCVCGIHAASQGREKRCPFCRTPPCSGKKGTIDRLMKRMKFDDGEAFYALGLGRKKQHQFDGAVEYWLRAAELGSTNASNALGNAYFQGEGVDKDEKKALYHWQIAAMGGDTMARYNVAIVEVRRGNTKRALKHWMIAANAGDDDSLKQVRSGFMAGLVTKDEYAKTLRANQESKDHTENDQRAAAAIVYRSRRSVLDQLI